MSDTDGFTSPRGADASRLRRRARRLLASFQVPDDALQGSLALSYRRCGKPSCHCAAADGHPLWKYWFGLPIASTAAVSGNTVIVTTWDGTVHAIVSAD